MLEGPAMRTFRNKMSRGSEKWRAGVNLFLDTGDLACELCFTQLTANEWRINHRGGVITE